MKLNTVGLEIIKEREGFSAKWYLDDKDGWTIGYGTLEPTFVRLTGQQRDMAMRITEPYALGLLHQHVESAVAPAIRRLVRVSLNENQYSALVSFVYNIGESQFATSTMRRKLNAGDYAGAAAEFPRWKFDDGQEQRGLVIRRAKERNLFETPVL